MLLVYTMAAPNLPPTDRHDHRRQNPNTLGYSDTRLNRTQRKFVRKAVEDTRGKMELPNGRVPVALELGGGMGDCLIAIRKRGGNILYIDESDELAAMARERATELTPIPPGFSDFWVGRMPIDPPEFRPSVDLLRPDHPYQVMNIGAFALMMYLSGDEMQMLFQWAFKLLPSGGQFFITGTSPHSNLFPGYEPKHFTKLLKFRDFPLSYPFPGWIPDVAALMQGHIPPKYFERYPNYFHLLDPEVLAHHAHVTGFVVLEAGFLHKRRPERLRYQGDDPTVGELTSLILLKP